MALRAGGRWIVYGSRLRSLSLESTRIRFIDVAVLITDAEGRGTLAACRGLHAQGYRVAAAAAERPALTHWSRCCADRLLTPDPRAHLGAFLASVEKLVGLADYAVLLPGSEASLVAFSEGRASLEPHVRLGLPSSDVVERCIDKIALLSEAEAAGLAAPESVVCTAEDDAVAAARELGFPVILKSRRSFVRRNEELTQSPTVVAVDIPAVASAVQRVGSPFVVQRFEPERIVSCSGVIADGALLAVAVSRYERTWPANAGPSAFAETVAPPGSLVERVEALLRGLGWQGIFQVQLLERPAKSYAMLDLNPRVFGSLALTIAAGANLPAVWCDWLLGRERPFLSARPGVRYRWEGGDARYALQQLRRARLRSAAAVMRPRRDVVHALFHLSDPAPLVAGAIAVGRRRAGS